MANEFFDPGEQRSAKVRELFGVIARRYDLLNDLMSLGFHRCWKQRVVALAGGRAGERALDLCCGTGDIGFRLAKRGLKVSALDFSEPMLRIALQRRGGIQPGTGAAATRPSAAGEPGNLCFVQGDAQRLPFEDNTFEIVTVGYGLRNLAEWKTGVGQMWRVARPGGRLLVLDFGKPDNPAWRAVYFGYLRLAVPMLGRIFCGNAGAYAYILESLRHYPAQHGVAAQMRELGMVNVRIVNLLGGVMTINYGEKI